MISFIHPVVASTLTVVAGQILPTRSRTPTRTGSLLQQTAATFDTVRYTLGTIDAIQVPEEPVAPWPRTSRPPRPRPRPPPPAARARTTPTTRGPTPSAASTAIPRTPPPTCAGSSKTARRLHGLVRLGPGPDRRLRPDRRPGRWHRPHPPPDRIPDRGLDTSSTTSTTAGRSRGFGVRT